MSPLNLTQLLSDFNVNFVECSNLDEVYGYLEALEFELDCLVNLYEITSLEREETIDNVYYEYNL